MNHDIIGDIHGHAGELRALLVDLGYRRHGRGYRHVDRTVVFVGDFVDRGPAIGEVIEIVRAMVDAGDAVAVMGNHEYNAIAFHTARPGLQEAWFRPHSDKNRKQHHETLTQLSPAALADAVEWFQTLPVALELDGIRVAHAAWQPRDIDCIDEALKMTGRLTADFLVRSEAAGSDLHRAVENVLKGPELRLPHGQFILDKANHPRETVRIKWYESGAGRTYREHHLGSDVVPDCLIDAGDRTPDGESAVDRSGATIEPYPADAVPVFVGHYWLTGTPVPLASNVACTDYSVAKGGKLVAYRWDGESVLSENKFHWVAN